MKGIYFRHGSITLPIISRTPNHKKWHVLQKVTDFSLFAAMGSFISTPVEISDLWRDIAGLDICKHAA